MNMFVLLLPVVLIRLSSVIAAAQLVPYVSWTMDKYNDTKLIPDYNTDPRFQSDFSRLSTDPTNVFRPGTVGNALYVSRNTLDLVENIDSTDCIREPEACDRGLSFTFWLNIEDWNNNLYQIFFRSTTATKSLPGIYFGKGEAKRLLVYFRGRSGQVYEVSFSKSFAWKAWAHIGIVWNRGVGFAIYVNGTVLNTLTKLTHLEAKDASLTDFVIGSDLAPSFLLDEFKIFYRNISSDEVMEIYNGVEESSTSQFIETTPDTETTAYTSIFQETSSVSLNDISTTFSKRPMDTTPGKDKQWETNILLAILLPILAAILIALLCMVIFFLCGKKRRGQKAEDLSQPAVQFKDG